MKELTTEQKAQRYDEAIKVAKSNYETIVQMDNDCTFAKEGIVNTFHHIFPELKESEGEDEKIRKALIDYFDDANKADENPLQVYGIHTDKAIAWLEKQGEQKPADKGEQKSADKVEPKFKVGDWITNGACIIKITSVDDRYYWHDNDCVGGDIESIDKEYHLWTIQDAKNGDVLAAHECLVLFKEIDGLNIKCYCTYHYMGCNPKFYVDTLQNKNAFYPATKEQRDLLFQKMKEAGYEWNAVKKELEKIEQKQWKPSEEQIYALRSVVTELKHSDNKYQETIEDLYQDLKKLREK